MLMMILSTLGLICLMTWGILAYLGRSHTLLVKAIDNPSGDLYLIHLTKPNHLSWKAGSYAKFTLPEIKDSRWLTIASTSVEKEILLLTHNSGSSYKKRLTHLEKGAAIKMSWLSSTLEIVADGSPLVCFASDLGISAIWPIIKEWTGKRSISVLHLDKGVGVFDEKLSAVTSQEQETRYEKSKSLEQSRDQLGKIAKQYGNQALYLLAGQPDDLAAIRLFLEERGIGRERLRLEEFKGLK